MTKNWKLKPLILPRISNQLPNYHPLTQQLLYNRNIADLKAAQEFLDPKYDGLFSPFLFRDMKKATARIWQAIENKEKIFIYGDYDADAVVANALLQQTFRYLNVTVESYIPDRFSEGYGINLHALEKIKSLGADLIITVDCGANAIAAAQFCNEKQINLIITDHHEILGEVPPVFAYINPKNEKDLYPDKEITGVGVAFKLACGILADEERVKSRFTQPLSPESASGGSGHSPQVLGRGNRYIDGWEKWLLDLVAIGTVADCHSLVGENRILVKYGLKVLTKTKWIGLKVLCTKAGLNFNNRPPDTYILGYIIAPRLNAAGRLEHATIALKLLLETDFNKAEEITQILENLNLKRQQLTSVVLSEARIQAQIIKERKILALMGTGWPKGVVGLVAGKIAEEFCRPTIVLEKGEAEITGSARTAGNFNIVEALKYASGYLIKYGGHKEAAGLTLKTEHFEIFYQTVLNYAEQNLKDEDLQKNLELEAEITEPDLNLKVYNLVASFEPFGIDNPKPLFLIRNAVIMTSRPVGNLKQHLQMQLKIGKKEVPAIAFNFGGFAKDLEVSNNTDIACELIKDDWNGNNGIKLKIVDIKKN